MTKIIPFPLDSSKKQQIRACIENGESIAFPTETFYALGGNAFSESLVERIFEIKKRPRHKPLLLLIEPYLLPKLSAPLSAQIKNLMEQFWPGPLTLILKAHPDIPHFLLGPQNTIAVRHSNSSIVQQLLSIGKCPFIGTSANLSQAPEATTPSGVLSQLNDMLDLLIDGGQTPGKNVSTIVDTNTSPFQIIRTGAIPEEQLKPYL
ncbi:MAG: threonylcarbamoyl-AMP synthase [SAR324 cluster bacterium]|nr:threonylcarbamoyl-AMP synthase [SAR324 cluster bacterium]